MKKTILKNILRIEKRGKCMNKKKIKLFRVLTVLMSLAMFLNSSSMTVLATGVGDFNDDSEEIIINPLSYSYGNLIYELDENGNAVITGNTITEDTDLIIPSQIDGHKVISIGDEAFLNCSNLTSVIIPDSVTSIGNYAFSFRDSSPNGVPGRDYADSYPSGLTSVTIPNSVISIGEGAFCECRSLTSVTISESLTGIEAKTFEGCSGLTSVIIPESVTDIGDSAFSYCTGLTSVTIPESVTGIGAYAFCECSSLTSITLPDNIISLGEGAISYCQSLTSITIPESLTSIGDCTLEGCRNLTSVTIPDSVTSLGNFSFSGCSSLTSITIPESVTNIGDKAFKDCTGLTSITIPDSVTSMGDDTFYYCSSLTSVKLSDSVKSIGEWTFTKCTNLTGVTIPDSVISIGAGAFCECESLTSITIPDSVTGIGYAAFSGCDNLTSITLSNSLKKIEYNTFNDCPKLESIIIYPETTTISEDSFSNPEILTIYGIAGSYAEEYAENNGIKFEALEIHATEISLNKSEMLLNVNDSEKLIVTVEPKVISDEIVWGSSNEGVAVVNNDGTVTAKKIGTAIITVKVGELSKSCKVNVTKPVTEITLNKISLDLTVNDSETLTATVKPDDATNKAVNWTSSNANVATVDANGLVTAVGAGSATITATAAGGSGVKATCKVTVTQPVTKITLNKTSLDLLVNKSETLTATVKPDNASDKEVNWTSTNANVATVDANGLVKAVGVGSATITATAADGSGVKATCKVTVTQPVIEITLNKTSLNLSVNKSETLTATVKPNNATNKAVNWKSTNTKVATVDANGLVKAVGAGSATITVTAADGSGVKAICEVTVVKLVSEITLDKTDLLLHVGESDSINAKVTPADASNKEITWTSTNADVATVDSTGKVTAVGVGTATITATATDESGISASATIKVTKLVTDVFDDVKSTDWFVKPVQYVYDHGIMAGTNGGKSFSPNGKLTREQFTQVLYAYEGKPEVTNMSGFSDVDPKAWYAKSVYWAKEKGITGGKPDGTFGVNENISRQDLAVMLYTYAKIKNYDLTKNDNALDNFDDKGKVSNYAKDAMKWAVTQGVISGKGNGKVDPIGNATRAECATMIMKLIEKNK